MDKKIQKLKQLKQESKKLNEEIEKVEKEIREELKEVIDLEVQSIKPLVTTFGIPKNPSFVPFCPYFQPGNIPLYSQPIFH